MESGSSSMDSSDELMHMRVNRIFILSGFILME
ncbi:hypothetical protein OXPF_01590 [Oxobacter pfennigii]|uniref:Uncharacterized protein n=1 Tax=Oxobacter pfennigii TaxID=36849 RepID=A0A0N8NTZ9_9CLOT|nr:hypothetical protein OXPF_01590 [Oxobacter pfennigii]